MRATLFVSVILLATLSATATAQTAPAAPQVTMGAQLKFLRFDWEPVAGATSYQLRMRVGNGAYNSVSGPLPGTVTNTRRYIAVHREDWANTRYQVLACNAAGCTASAELNPQPLVLETIGYFKASNTDPEDLFGRDVVISDDGLTLAVSAEFESSSATGVNGNQADNSMPQSGAVYIFRGSGSRWRQEAYLKPPLNNTAVRFGTSSASWNYHAMALSRDGSMAVIAGPGQDASNFQFAGEVYVFQRGSTGWQLTETLRSPDPSTSDFFGFSIDLSLDGKTLKIGSRQPGDQDGNVEGRTHLYRRVGSTWQREVTLAPFYAGDFCPVSRLSGDGLTLVMNCYSLTPEFRLVTYKRIGSTWVHVSDLPLTRYSSERGLALNHDGTALALGLVQNQITAVGVYYWNGSGWVNENILSPPRILSSDPGYGWALAFDRPGNQLAVGGSQSTAGGAGVSGTVTPGSGAQGAVFFYRRSSAATAPWRLRSVVKAPNPGNGDLFGVNVSLSGSGRTLAVAAPFEDSSARGVDGNQSSESAQNSGAAYLY